MSNINIIKERATKILNTSELNDDDKKGQWVDCDEETLKNTFACFLDEEQLGPEFDFHKVYDADWYREKFSGLCDEAYSILEEEDKKLNNHISEK
jgi:hypothetical protein